MCYLTCHLSPGSRMCRLPQSKCSPGSLGPPTGSLWQRTVRTSVCLRQDASLVSLSSSPAAECTASVYDDPCTGHSAVMRSTCLLRLPLLKFWLNHSLNRFHILGWINYRCGPGVWDMDKVFCHCICNFVYMLWYIVVIYCIFWKLHEESVYRLNSRWEFVFLTELNIWQVEMRSPHYRWGWMEKSCKSNITPPHLNLEERTAQ